MSVPRFLAPALDPDQPDVMLPPDEARHLTRVLRLGAGAQVAVFDGTGREFLATVIVADRDRVILRLEQPVASIPAPRISIVLAQAVLKGDKMDAVVRDATMLGVSEVIPLVTEHVSVNPAALKRGAPEERWRRVAVASAKQCRRATVPKVHRPVRFAEWIALEGTGGPGPGAVHQLILVEPAQSMEGTERLRLFLAGPRPMQVTIAAGPEGGWSRREIETATAAGYAPITLGELTLRADAAALVALSAVVVAWEG